MTPRLVVVGTPTEKRTIALLDAVARSGGEAVCVPWTVALSEPQTLAHVGRAGDFLRVESPGADAATWHALSRLGGDARVYDRGRWRPGASWFRGLSRALEAFDAHAPALHATHPSAQILAMTDKRACHERLEREGVPVPQSLGSPRSATALRDAMDDARRSAVFVKPRYGSSGAGVMAFRRSGDRETLTTTAALVEGVLVNRKRLSRYEDRERIDAVLDAVLEDGALVERWIPKASREEGPMDLRVLVIRGTIAQSVARVGRGTITNLHLDAARLDVGDALARFGRAKRAEVDAICLSAARCFPGHHTVGIDVMLDTHGKVFVLECNAWGDYLPNLLVDGCDSYALYARGLFGGEARS